MINSIFRIGFLFVFTLVLSCTETEKPVVSSNPSTTPSPKKETPKPSTPKASKTSNLKYFNSPEFGFKIKQPANWQVVEKQMKNVPVAFVNRPSGSYSSGAQSITVAVDPNATNTLEGYVELSRQQLLASGQIEFIIEETDGKNEESRPFKRIIFKRKSDSVPITAISFLYHTPGQIGYVVTCTSEENNFTKMRPFFEEIAGSIRF